MDFLAWTSAVTRNGRGIAEHILSGTYQTLDLSSFGFERILTKTPLPETAII